MVRERTRVFAPVRGGAGVRPVTPISPNRWKGETDCIVGPFSNRGLAYGFANVTTDFGQYGGVRFHVFAKRDSWYVEVQAQA
ncbi:MAG: hypothetical protein P8Y13_01185 [Deinococcales bacterium]